MSYNKIKTGKLDQQERGALYEQYIGSMYEQSGWEVTYYGIEYGNQDLGRDLICKKEGKTVIIQCKYLSKNSHISPQIIYQLVGTSIEYEIEECENGDFETNVREVLYTSTSLFERAKKSVERLDIEVHSCEDMYHNDRPPKLIKSITSPSGERIFYLPFDEEYFKIRTNIKAGDMYCQTVAEAEAAGYKYAHNVRIGESKSNDSNNKTT